MSPISCGGGITAGSGVVAVVPDVRRGFKRLSAWQSTASMSAIIYVPAVISYIDPLQDISYNAHGARMADI